MLSVPFFFPLSRALLVPCHYTLHVHTLALFSPSFGSKTVLVSSNKAITKMQHSLEVPVVGYVEYSVGIPKALDSSSGTLRICSNTSHSYVSRGTLHPDHYHATQVQCNYNMLSAFAKADS